MTRAQVRANGNGAVLALVEDVADAGAIVAEALPGAEVREQSLVDTDRTLSIAGTARAVGRCPADIAYTFPLVVAGAVLRAASRAGPLGTRVTGPTRIALTLATSRADPASTAVGVATAVEHSRAVITGKAVDTNALIQAPLAGHALALARARERWLTRAERVTWASVE